ncbi:TRAP transporter substrate-binding protein [Pseudorhodoplanes sp.]|uniref:TRAP transporter substrate-binding protein n=1 Tax=Pseudorhodoplanes sp. TaxID=1934341 RepID=UPI003D0E9690
MKYSRRKFIALAASSVATPALVGISRARAQAPVTLKLHHYLPPSSNLHAKLYVPWAEKLSADSGGRLKVDIFPAMQLGGTLPQLYDQARQGVVDMVSIVPGATPGRFPATEVIELPFVPARRGIVNAQACQEFAEKHLGNTFADVKLLSFWAHDQGVIHSNRPVTSMKDMKGLRLRSPSRLTGEALTALGATPIGMPIPQIPEALAQRTLDGAVVPWEPVPSLRINELVSNHTSIDGSPTLYVVSLGLVMNQDSFNRLPDDLKAILERNSGMTFARRAGQMWDDAATQLIKSVGASGRNKLLLISGDEKARWMEATAGVLPKWVAGMKSRGVDGDELVSAMRKLVAKYDAN